jgi:hypothetical protein
MNKKLETAKMQNAAEKLRADKIQHNLTHALQENIELRTGATASESRFILVDTILQREGDAELIYRLKDCSQLEDIINCKICGLKMWTPHLYVLFATRLQFTAGCRIIRNRRDDFLPPHLGPQMNLYYY